MNANKKLVLVASLYVSITVLDIFVNWLLSSTHPGGWWMPLGLKVAKWSCVVCREVVFSAFFANISQIVAGVVVAFVAARYGINIAVFLFVVVSYQAIFYVIDGQLAKLPYLYLLGVGLPLLVKKLAAPKPRPAESRS